MKPKPGQFYELIVYELHQSSEPLRVYRGRTFDEIAEKSNSSKYALQRIYQGKSKGRYKVGGFSFVMRTGFDEDSKSVKIT